jgi:hypothetical protein
MGAWPFSLAVINVAIAKAFADVAGGGFALPNAEATTLEPGTPVADFAGLGARRGVCTSLALSEIVGLVTIATAATLYTPLQQAGPLVLTTAQWDARTGQTGGLTPGAAYYLDVVAGRITTSAQTQPGRALTAIGTAIAPTTMLLAITRPILL